jgi:hypothetical protein
MARIALWALLVSLASWHLTPCCAEVTVPSELKFGMTVEPNAVGLVVLAIDDGVSIADKLRARDVIISHRLLGEFVRPTPVHSNDQLEDVKKLLKADKAVELTVLRPKADDDKNAGYDQVLVVLGPADIYVVRVAPAVRERSYTVTKSVPEIGMPEKEPTHTVVEVFYGTDRTLVGGQYTGQMAPIGSPIKLGVCRVSVPKKRRQGEIPRPNWWPSEWREDPSKHIILTTVAECDTNDLFLEALSEQLGKADGKKGSSAESVGENGA